jgi:ribonuclease III
MTETATLSALEAAIGYTFSDPGALRQAMAHRSWCAEHPGVPSNERLEFLGDAVLGWVVADLVYRGYADRSEGQLTDVRKAVVNAQALAEVAVWLDIGPHLLLGKGEAAAGGATKVSILADALEAVIGAVYLDGGVEAARSFVERIIAPRVDEAARGIRGVDHKTLLQELSMRMFSRFPRYEITESGPDHAKEFVAIVTVDGEERGRGEGRSKKAAEQVAARMAFELLSSVTRA